MAIGIIDKCRLSILIFVSVSALSGCAVHYVDEFGANHMWGFVHVVNREERKEGSTIANLHQVTAFGLYYISMEQQSSIGLGYSKNFELSVENDKAVDIVFDPSKPYIFHVERFNDFFKRREK